MSMRQCDNFAVAISSREAGCVSVIALSRTGDPSLGEFADPLVLGTFGDETRDKPLVVNDKSPPQKKEGHS